MLSVRCNGVPLEFSHHVADLSLIYRWPGGFHEATWNLETAYGRRPRALVQGAMVQIYSNTALVASGRLRQADWSSGEFVAEGLYREAESYAAFTPGLNTSAIPDEAIDAAGARGIPWTRIDSFSATAFGDSADTDGINTLESLMTAYSTSVNKSWWIDARGIVRLDADPTVPRWHVTPGTAELGLASDDYASDVYVRFAGTSGNLTAAASVDADTRSRYGRREHMVDITGQPVSSPTTAQQIATSIAAAGQAKLDFTTNVEATPYTLLTPGGKPAPLALVRAGQMIRVHGQRDDLLNGTTFLDVVVAESKWTVGEPVVTLTPKGMVPQTLAEVTEAQFAAVTGLSFKS